MAADYDRNASRADKAGALRTIPNAPIELTLSTTAATFNFAALGTGLVDLRGKFVFIVNPSAIAIRYRRGNHVVGQPTPLTTAKGLRLPANSYEEFYIAKSGDTGDPTPTSELVTFIAESGTPTISIEYDDEVAV